jgi:hypothetical protein
MSHSPAKITRIAQNARFEVLHARSMLACIGSNSFAIRRLADEDPKQIRCGVRLLSALPRPVQMRSAD